MGTAPRLRAGPGQTGAVDWWQVLLGVLGGLAPLWLRMLAVLWRVRPTA